MRICISLSAEKISFPAAKKGSKEIKRQYLLALWRKLNKEKFGGQLPKPADVQAQTRAAVEKITPKQTRGYWLPDDRIIAISTDLFNSDNESQVHDTLLHEMCHQAVTDIDKAVEKNPHGPKWVKWVKRVGLNQAHIGLGKWSDDMAKVSAKGFDIYPANQVYEGDRVQTILMNKEGNLLVEDRSFEDGFITFHGTFNGLKDIFGTPVEPSKGSLRFARDEKVKVLKFKKGK